MVSLVWIDGDVITYHLRSSNFENITISRAQRSLASNHISAVTEHQNAHEGIAVGVPADDGLVIFPWATGNSFIFFEKTFL